MSYEESLIRKIDELGDPFEFDGPQTEESVRVAEDALGVKFPPSYSVFLRKYGAAGVCDSWISGIFDDDPLEDGGGNVVFDTIYCRKTFNLPEHLIVIYLQDDEVVWGLDSSQQDENGEYPVLSYDVFNKKLDDGRIADTFQKYFIEYLKLRAEVDG